MRISVVNSTCYIDFDDWRIVVEDKKNGGGQAVKKLNDTTYRVLEILASHAGEFVSKATLLREWRGLETDRQSAYNEGYDDEYHNAIKSCRALFRDLDIEDVIENRHGVGYCYRGKKITNSHPGSTRLDMGDVQGFCICDTDHSGCRVLRGRSGPEATTAEIDFSLTSSSLCSVVYFTGVRDWSELAASHRLCFEAQAVPGPVEAEVEVRLKGGRDRAVSIQIQAEKTAFAIPLLEFSSPEGWEGLQEIHLLLRRRAVAGRTAVVLEHLRLEE